MTKKLKLHLLNEAFTINKLPQFAEIPSILGQGEMCFVFRTDEELTIVCPDYMAPNNVQQELGWRCLRVEGEMNLKEVARELAQRLVRLFVQNEEGKRACHGKEGDVGDDDRFKERVLFHEYFNGDTGEGLGASHQTGWTALVARLIESFCTEKESE